MKPFDPKFDILLEAIEKLGYCYVPYLSSLTATECVGVNVASNPYLAIAELSAYMTANYFYTDDIDSVLGSVSTFFDDMKIDHLPIFGDVIYFPKIVVR